jgi:hypothetical protein
MPASIKKCAPPYESKAKAFMFFKRDPTYQYVAESVSQLTEAGRGEG